MVPRRALFSFFLLPFSFLPGCAQQPQLSEPPPLEVTISQPVKDYIEDWDTYTGLVQAKYPVEIRPRVRGHITDVKFKEGSEVKEGAVLFLIDDGPFKAQLKQAEGQLQLNQARLKLADERIGILKPLVKSGSAAKQELDKVVADKGEAIGGMASTQGQIDEARLNIDYCRITAPISGRISRAYLTKGSLVNVAGDNLLTTIVPVDPMYVSFDVNERALQRYQKQAQEEALRNKKAGQDPSAEVIKVQMGLASDRDFPYAGVISFIDNRIDPATGTMNVWARFNNPKMEFGGRAMTPGMFARVRVAVSDRYKAILVADRAVLTDQNLKYVLTINKSKENLVERVDIEPGRLQEDGLRVVENGLKGNEWIIVEGVTMVRPGIAVAAREAPMPRRPGQRDAAKPDSKGTKK